MKYNNSKIPSGLDQRKSKRVSYNCQIRCLKHLIDGKEIELDAPIDLEVINISVNGLGVLSENSLREGMILVLYIKINDVVFERVLSKVLWTISLNQKYKVGMEILNISGKLYRQICDLDNSISLSV